MSELIHALPERGGLSVEFKDSAPNQAYVSFITDSGPTLDVGG